MTTLTDLLNGSSDLGDQEASALQQKLLAQKLREGMRAPREFWSATSSAG
jgi:hypothetical protein